MRKEKKGQAAASAAVLIAIIAALIIGFIILIPPADRAELLGETTSSTSSGTTIDSSSTEKVLLTANPGRIDYFAQKEVEHPLPVINIYTKTESKVLAKKNLAYAKKGVFTEEFNDFTFSVSDIENTKNLLLSFNVKEIEGALVILLNGEQIFLAEVGAGLVEPISLPINSLQEQNTLTFAVSSPGIAFWQTNELSLENIQLVADVTSLSAQTSKNVFLVSETEKENMEKVMLSFQPECNFVNVGKLSIRVNGNEIYNAVPDCDLVMVPIEFSADNIYQGENQIVFSAEKGTYLLSHVMIRSKLQDLEFPTYYFELSHEEFEDVQSEEKRVRLQMDFVDVINQKKGDIVFNGHVENFETKEVTITLDLSEDVVQGNNAIKIKPKKTLEIRELKVELVK